MNRQLELLAGNKGFDSLSDLARAMDKSPSAFFNNLKYFSETRNYRSKFARQLYDILGVSEEEFRDFMQDSVNVHGSRKNLSRVIDTKATPFFDLKSSQQRDFHKIIEELDNGDICTSVTRNIPAEFSSEALQRTMLSAMSRGVRFRYLFPRTEANSKTKEGLLPDHFEFFVEEMVQNWVNLGFQAESDRDIRSLMSFALTDDPILSSHLHSYLAIEQQVNGAPKYFILEEISLGRISSMYDEGTANVWYPMSSILALYVARKINRQFPGSSGDAVLDEGETPKGLPVNSRSRRGTKV